MVRIFCAPTYRRAGCGLAPHRGPLRTV